MFCWQSALALTLSVSVRTRASSAVRHAGVCPLSACLAMVHVACLVWPPTPRGRPSVTSYAYGLYEEKKFQPSQSNKNKKINKKHTKIIARQYINFWWLLLYKNQIEFNGLIACLKLKSPNERLKGFHVSQNCMNHEFWSRFLPLCHFKTFYSPRTWTLDKRLSLS